MIALFQILSRDSLAATRLKAETRNPSKQGWAVCRVHGAGGGAPRGKAHPNYKHGMRTREWVEMRKVISEICKPIL